MFMNCILQRHWEDSDDYKDLEEEHDSNCKLHASASFPHDPLLSINTWDSSDNCDDVDDQRVFQIDVLEDHHCNSRGSSSEHGEVHTSRSGDGCREVKLYEDRLECYTWAKSNCSGKESCHKPNDDELQGGRISELDFTLDELISDSLFLFVLNLHHSPSSYSQQCTHNEESSQKYPVQAVTSADVDDRWL